MKSLFSLSISLFFMATSWAAQEETLLAYWNFNNSEKGTEIQLGRWHTEPGLFGEVFDEAKMTLSSNTDMNAVFASESYIDFSQLTGQYSGNARNAFGVFTDTRAGRLREDRTEGGSFMAGTETDTSHLLIVTSTEGYKNIVIRVAMRSNRGQFQWAWSTNGTDFTQFADDAEPTNFRPTEYRLSGPESLGFDQVNNQKKLYIRVTFLFPNKPAGNVALDNIQIWGSK